MSRRICNRIGGWAACFAVISLLAVQPAKAEDWKVVGAGDFTGDHRSDVLWQHGRQLGVWIEDGHFNSTWHVLNGITPVGWSIVGTGDFNGDGVADILFENFKTHQLGVWFEDGHFNGTWQLLKAPSDWGAVGAGWQIVGTGDYNHDGISDILWQNGSQLGLWVENSGLTPTWQLLSAPENWTAVGAGWQVIGGGDYNGDGTSDILWQNGSQLGVWVENSGLTATWQLLTDTAPAGWQVAGTGDFNGDGTADILWTNGQGEVGVWILNAQLKPTWQVLNGNLPASVATNPVPVSTIPSVYVPPATSPGVTNVLGPNFGLSGPTNTILVDYSHLHSVATFQTRFDTYTATSNTNQVQVTDTFQYRNVFFGGQVGFAGQPSGRFDDMFPMFPAANFGGDVNSGNVYDLILDGGYNFYQVPGFRVGGFAGYYLFHESLSGMTAGAITTSSVLDTNWQALRTGLVFEKTFFGGQWVLEGNVVGMPAVNLDSGAFSANGSGIAGGATLSFPIPNVPMLHGNIFFQDTYMKVSGDSSGTPMDVKNNNLTVGGGLTFWTQGFNQAAGIKF